MSGGGGGGGGGDSVHYDNVCSRESMLRKISLYNLSFSTSIRLGILLVGYRCLTM